MDMGLVQAVVIVLGALLTLGALCGIAMVLLKLAVVAVQWLLQKMGELLVKSGLIFLISWVGIMTFLGHNPIFAIKDFHFVLLPFSANPIWYVGFIAIGVGILLLFLTFIYWIPEHNRRNLDALEYNRRKFDQEHRLTHSS